MIDILLAVYNGADFLSEQIESIRCQDYTNWHLMISDDGSSDDSLLIIQKATNEDSRIEQIQTGTQHKNPRYHFLDLLARSRAEYFAFCDQDDYWESNKLSVSTARLKQLEQKYGKECPLLVYSDMSVVDEELNEISGSFMRFSGMDERGQDLEHLLSINLAAGCTVTGNAALRKLICEYTTDYEDSRILMHDWWAILLAICFGHVERIPGCYVRYRQHGTNSVGAKRYSMWNIPQKLVKLRDNEKNYWDTCRQASLLYALYGDIMPVQSSKIIMTYAESIHRPRLEVIVKFYRMKMMKLQSMQRIGQLVMIILHKPEAIREH